MGTKDNSPVRSARERAGLPIDEVVARTGIDRLAYLDLEAHEGELWMSFSLSELQTLAQVLATTPRDLLGVDPVPRQLTPSELVERIRHHLALSGESVQVFEERAGWSIAGLLRDPHEYYQLNADGLVDICNAARIDWREALPPWVPLGGT